MCIYLQDVELNEMETLRDKKKIQVGVLQESLRKMLEGGVKKTEMIEYLIALAECARYRGEKWLLRVTRELSSEWKDVEKYYRGEEYAVVYIIVNTKTKRLYVGVTEQNVYTRYYEHLKKARNSKEPMYKYMRKIGLHLWFPVIVDVVKVNKDKYEKKAFRRLIEEHERKMWKKYRDIAINETNTFKADKSNRLRGEAVTEERLGKRVENVKKARLQAITYWKESKKGKELAKNELISLLCENDRGEVVQTMVWCNEIDDSTEIDDVWY